MSFNGDLYPTTGASAVMTTKGDMVDYDTIRQRLAIGSANQILQVKSNLPSWETVPLADTVLTTAGDVLYENATPELARLPVGSNGDVLTLAGGLPTWATAGGGATVEVVTVHLTASFSSTETGYPTDITDFTLVRPTISGGKTFTTANCNTSGSTTQEVWVIFNDSTGGNVNGMMATQPYAVSDPNAGGAMSAVEDADGGTVQMKGKSTGGTWYIKYNYSYGYPSNYPTIVCMGVG